MGIQTVIRSGTNSLILLRKKFATITSVFTIIFLSFSTSAVDFTASVFKGDESDTSGFSLFVADSFTKKSNFYWNIGYTGFSDVVVEWNNQDLLFDVDTADILLSYRYKPKSYSKVARSLTFEYFVGASMVLTENKFVWPELDEERLFSEKGDVNGVVGMNLHYNFTKQTAVVLGFKYHPEFSEFDNMTSVHIGINYKFSTTTY